MSPRPHLTSIPSIGSARITAVLGDITNQTDCDAIVNAANTGLRKGGGVCGAIYRAAGPDLETYTDRLEPIRVGEAIITPGFRLPNAWVIHVAGPRYGVDADSSTLLSLAMRNVLALADATKLVRVAVPAISTGIYGYPIEQAGTILMETAKAIAVTLQHVREIRFVLFSKDAMRHFDVDRQPQQSF